MKTPLSLKLGTEKLKKLAEYVVQREGLLKTEMSDWRNRRELYERFMLNDFSARRTAADERREKETKNIYDLSNETMGLVRSAITFVAARTREDIFGSNPWMAARPVGLQDEPLAALIQHHLPWKIGQSNFQDVGEEGIDRCFNLGETILKQTWTRKVQRFERFANVLTDPAQKVKRPTGRKLDDGSEEQMEHAAPVLTEAGDYVFDTDPLVKRAVNEDQSLGPVLRDPAPMEAEGAAGEGELSAGAEVQNGSGAVSMPQAGTAPAEVPHVMVVEKDPDVVVHEALAWEPYCIPDEVVTFEGLNVEPVDFRQFRAPMNVARLEDMDFRGHVYSQRLSDLKARVIGPMDEETKTLFEKLRKGDSTPKTDEEKKDGAATPRERDEQNPSFQCIDVELEWDPDGQGDTVWIYATVLIEEREVLFADYLANVTPKGQSMFSVAAINQPLGRWHGRGWYELYGLLMDAIDKHFNLVMYRNHMAANPICGVHENAIEEELEEIEIVPGFRVTLKDNKTLKDFIEFMQIPEFDSNTWQIIEMMIKLFQLETGVTSAAQGGLGDLPATNTATGIQSVLSSGSTLQKRPTQEIRRGYEDALRKAAKLIYTRQNRDETFNYGEGDKLLATLPAARVAGLEVDVTLTLTRFRQREDIENAMACLEVVDRYLALPEQEKAAVRPLYVQILRGHDIQNAETIIREPVQVDPNANATQNLKEFLEIKFVDLPPAARAQVLTQMGFRVTEEQMRAWDTEQNAADEKTKQPPKEKAA